MSYSIYSVCGKCVKSKRGCKDLEKIQKAVNEIHMSTDHSHQGYGSIHVACQAIETEGSK